MSPLSSLVSLLFHVYVRCTLLPCSLGVKILCSDRLVNRISGCSSMTCGSDAHTRANVQNGCLRRFDWDAAKPYQPQQVGANVKFAPTFTQKVRHEYWHCAVCQKEVVGLRFECVNCASYTLCEQCESDHWNSHVKGHFFKIHQHLQMHQGDDDDNNTNEADMFWSFLGLPWVKFPLFWKK